jgi:Cellulase (glycosyl hydrolase family 5)
VRVLVRWLVVVCALAATAPAAVAAPPPSPYHVSGNKVLGRNGNRFVPYGFVIDCAAPAKPVASLCRGGTKTQPWTGARMLAAAARFWHADVVRIQVASDQLMPGQDTINRTYLKLIDRLVARATRLHLVTILSLQTEYFNGPALPTTAAVRFWRFVAHHFKTNPDVMFDLYNEPRLRPSATLSESELWALWQHGGTFDGVRYVGDNALIKTIRHQHSRNVIIAESNQFDRDLSQLPTHLLTDPGHNTIYGVEPNLNGKDKTKAEWKVNFGDLAGRLPIFPEAFLPRFAECNASAPKLLPRLLNYLRQIQMGAIVWTLQPGITTQGPHLGLPTTFSPKNAPTDPCLIGQATHAAVDTTYGEGADIRRFFIALSGA